MNKAYVIAPLVGLLAFGGFYGFYKHSHDARQAAQEQADELARTEKLRAENALKVAAHLQATQALEQRKQERAAQLRLEASRAQATFEAERRRDTEVARVRKLQSQLTRLQDEAGTTRTALTRAEQQKSELEREQRFLAEQVKATGIDRDLYLRLLDEMAAAERPRPVTPAPSRTGSSSPD